MQTDNKHISTVMSFSPSLYQFAIKKAKQKGVTLQQYLDHLLIQEQNKEKEPLYLVDEETEQRIAESIRDYENGDYTVCKTVKETMQHLKKLG